MKFTLENKATVAKKVLFDFQKAELALSASFNDVSDAYEKLIDKEGECVKAAKVMNDIRLATESLTRFGVSATNIAIFNGKNRALDSALGMETLSVAQLQSMGQAAKTALKDKYLAGLEDVSEETKKTFFERVKEWWNQFVTWLKELFTSTAKLVKMVEESKFDNLDTGAKVNILTYDDAKSLVDGMKKCNERIDNIANQKADFVTVSRGQFDASTVDLSSKEKKSGTVAELGWDAAKANSLKNDFVSCVRNTHFQAAWAKIQNEYRNLEAKNDTGSFDKLKARFDEWRNCGKITGDFNRAARAVGFALYTLGKANGEAKKEETPAAAPAEQPAA